MTVIRDPSSQKGQEVDDNGHAHVLAFTEGAFTKAAQDSGAYNINTGLISALTGTSGHAVLYFLNDEAPVNGVSDIIIDAFALWTGTRSATVTDDPVWTIYKNPDGGDIISDKTLVSINSNSNFGVNTALSSTSVAYKGKSTGTITATDGQHAIIGGTGRIYAAVPILLGRGDAIGISVDINTSGACDAYAALIMRRVDGNATAS